MAYDPNQGYKYVPDPPAPKPAFQPVQKPAPPVPNKK
jgi:hypothetical protein